MTCYISKCFVTYHWSLECAKVQLQLLWLDLVLQKCSNYTNYKIVVMMFIKLKRICCYHEKEKKVHTLFPSHVPQDRTAEIKYLTQKHGRSVSIVTRIWSEWSKNQCLIPGWLEPCPDCSAAHPASYPTANLDFL